MIIFFRIRSESPNMRKVSLMLEETALPYVVKLVAPRTSEPPDAQFAEISPNGTTPAIVDAETGVGLFESAAILQFLAEKSAKLLPSSLGARAEVVKWLTFEAANVCPTMIELHHYLMNDDGGLPEAIMQRYRNRLARHCAILDRQLDGREFLAGEYSIADVALYPWTLVLEDMAEISLADYPRLNNWARTIGDRPTTRRMSESGPPRTEWCYRNGDVELCSA